MDMATHVVTVSELLQGNGSGSGKPFFAYLGFQANHVPVRAPQSFIDKYKGRYKDGWTALRQARRDRAAELCLIPQGAPMVTMSTTGDWNSLSDKERRLAERQMEVYAAMAEAMDHHVGRLVFHLKQTGEFDNTVFVFLSDNGAEHTYSIHARGGRVPRCRHYRPRSSGPVKLTA